MRLQVETAMQSLTATHFPKALDALSNYAIPLCTLCSIFWVGIE